MNGENITGSTIPEDKEDLKIEWEKARIKFQGFLIEKILGKKPVYKTDEEWNSEKIKFVLDRGFGQKFSDAIDNDENIKSIILKGKDYYDEAAKIVIDKLGLGVRV